MSQSLLTKGVWLGREVWGAVAKMGECSILIIQYSEIAFSFYTCVILYFWQSFLDLSSCVSKGRYPVMLRRPVT